jgi:beta-glucosidase
MGGWMNFNDPLDDTKTYNATGLVRNSQLSIRHTLTLSKRTFDMQAEMMAAKSGSIWAGYLTQWDKFVYGVTIGQRYLMENTTLGIPALIQSEGVSWFHVYSI